MRHYNLLKPHFDYTSNRHVTHWGRVTHKCVGNVTIIGSDNGLSPVRRQAIIWTNDGILLIGPSGTNFSKIYTFHSRKCVWKGRLRNAGHFVSAPNLLIGSLSTVASWHREAWTYWSIFKCIKCDWNVTEKCLWRFYLWLVSIGGGKVFVSSGSSETISSTNINQEL